MFTAFPGNTKARPGGCQAGHLEEIRSEKEGKQRETRHCLKGPVDVILATLQLAI